MSTTRFFSLPSLGHSLLGPPSTFMTCPFYLFFPFVNCWIQLLLLAKMFTNPVGLISSTYNCGYSELMSAAVTSCPEDSTSWYSFPSLGSSVMFPNPGEEGIKIKRSYLGLSTQELFLTPWRVRNLCIVANRRKRLLWPRLGNYQSVDKHQYLGSSIHLAKQQ